MSFQYRLKAQNVKNVPLPKMASTSLELVRNEILDMEEKSWKFFNPRNIQWNLIANRDNWVCSSYIINRGIMVFNAKVWMN